MSLRNSRVASSEISFVKVTEGEENNNNTPNQLLTEPRMPAQDILATLRTGCLEKTNMPHDAMRSVVNKRGTMPPTYPKKKPESVIGEHRVKTRCVKWKQRRVGRQTDREVCFTNDSFEKDRLCKYPVRGIDCGIPHLEENWRHTFLYKNQGQKLNWSGNWQAVTVPWC